MAGQSACLFLPVLLGSLPFPTFDPSPNHPVTIIVQSPNFPQEPPRKPWALCVAARLVCTPFWRVSAAESPWEGCHSGKGVIGQP